MTMPSRVDYARFVAVCFALAAAAADAASETYPARPIRFISPFAPGGGNDTISRVLTQAMARNIGQSIVVENRPGANTVIGMEIVARAPADGYTLIMTSSSLAINAALYRKLPYDSARAFAPVSLIASSPQIVVVHPSLPIRTIRGLIELAKAKPGELLYPVSGVGNISHLAGELFNLLAGVKLVSVPYKGAAPGLNDLLAGRLSVGFSSALAASTHIRSGRLRVLAVTSNARLPSMPAVATVAEAGLAGYEASTWYGVLAPAHTPNAIVQRLAAEIARALGTDEVTGGLAAQGLELAGGSPEQFAAHIRAEMDKWANVIRVTGIRLE